MSEPQLLDTRWCTGWVNHAYRLEWAYPLPGNYDRPIEYMYQFKCHRCCLTCRRPKTDFWMAVS